MPVPDDMPLNALSSVLSARKEPDSAHTKRRKVRLMAQALARSSEALRLYEPLPYQDAFHACRAKECVIQKGNRTGGPTRLSEPVLTPDGWLPIGELKVGDSIIGGDGKPCRVTGVFPQGWKAIFKLTFDDGASTVCCEDHYWKCKLTKRERFPSHPNYNADLWGVRSLHDIRKFGGDNPIPRERMEIPVAVCELAAKDVPLDPYTLGVLLGDGAIAHAAVNFTTGDREIADEVSAACGDSLAVSSLPSSDITYSIVKSAALVAERGKRSPNPAREALDALGLAGCRSESKFIPLDYLWNSVDVRLATLQGLMDTDGYADKRGLTYFYTCSPTLANDVLNLVRSLGGKGRVSWKETFVTTRSKKSGRPTKAKHSHVERDLLRRRCLHMAIVAFRLPRQLCPFRLERKVERWRKYGNFYTGNRLLVSVEPAGNAECVCISVDSPDHTYVTKDYVVTHNTVANMVEVARAVTGQDPHNKYPKRDGRAVVLGYGEPHIGRVFFAKLFKPGAFWIIRDLKTNEWRTARQWPAARGGDLERWSEVKPAPPLIPGRFIDGKISWVKKNMRVFDLVRFTTGWELHAMNSAGDPGQAQGFSVNLYAIDEDLATSGWREEAGGRIADCGGLLRWSAIPHARNDDLMQLLDFAEKEADKPDPGAVVIRASILDNPHQDQVSRDKQVEAWRAMGEDVYRKRVMGEMDIQSILMYPTFNRRIHDVMVEHPEDSEATKILRANNGEPPPDWTLYLSLDPGHTVCATVFVAVPPPELGEQMFVFDELYIPQCHAPIWGEAVEQKIRDRVYHRFYIDMHGGSLRSVAGGAQPVEAYIAELKNRNLASDETGSAFMAGFDEVARREERMRTHLAMLHDGRPRLMFVMGRCPKLAQEMEKFRKITTRVGTKDIPTDKGNRKHTHAIEALEQMVAFDLPYAKPRKRAENVNFFDRFIKWRDDKRRARMEASPMGGGSISLGPVGVTS